MDVYPLNLIVAVATAWATVFIGFLPTKIIRSDFFGRQALVAAIAWFFVAVSSPPEILHYDIFFAILCFGSWWKFRQDRALSGKMWMSMASGLGISIGIVLILVVTPHALPGPAAKAGLPVGSAAPLISIYLGGAVIGMAYVIDALTRTPTPISAALDAIIQRYAGLLVILAVARAAILLTNYFREKVATAGWLSGQRPSWLPETVSPNDVRVFETGLALGLGVLVLPSLTFLARQAVGVHALGRARTVLILICVTAFLTELLTRLCVL